MFSIRTTGILFKWWRLDSKEYKKKQLKMSKNSILRSTLLKHCFSPKHVFSTISNKSFQPAQKYFIICKRSEHYCSTLKYTIRGVKAMAINGYLFLPSPWGNGGNWCWVITGSDEELYNHLLTVTGALSKKKNILLLAGTHLWTSSPWIFINFN